MELAGGLVGFVLIGYWIDWKFRTSPWGLVIGATLGGVGGVYNLIRRARQMQQDFNRPTEDQTKSGDEKRPDQK